MGRKPTPQPLMLAEPNSTLDHVADDEPTYAETTAQGASPVASRSPVSLRSSPFSSRFAHKRPQPGRSALQPADDVNHRSQSPRDDSVAPTYHTVSSALDSPPVSTSQHAGRHHGATESKKPVKSGFFHFNKSSKGSNQFLIPANQQRHQDSREHLTSSGSDGVTVPRRGDSPYAHDPLHKPTTSFHSRSELSLSSAGDHEPTATSSPGKKNKSNPFGLLGRTKSTHEIKGLGSPKAGPAALHAPSCKTDLYESAPLRTAPVGQDRTFRDMMSSTVRNRSEDRVPGRDAAAGKESHRDRDQRALSSLRDNGGSNFLSGLRSSSTKAADMISKGLFGKSPRSGGTSERDFNIDDEHYLPKVINLPLVEQTRLTRISKRLEDSKDKTEFWMPAFPWRAIDYLNYKGCDVEGLYRVPGSGPQVKKWQRKFDEDYDVNLFQQDGLYDINIIGSMLKAWLRELPDELFPKEAQDRIARECAGSTTVPQMLIDELSELSPFNYYLLFAITCHLSLLLAHSDKNKMDFRNLCICFQPCMKIDAFCFKFLVCDWRDCWKGCKNENKYIEEEYALFDQPPPRGLSEPRQPGKNEKHEARQGSSPESAQKSSSGSGQRKGRSKKHRHGASESNASIGSNESSFSTNPSSQSDRIVADGSRDLRPLSPIKPLSPLGF
ncbi:rhoGAP domain-containing protein [Hirsutella rhossiliensis]|uniref:RhoGAP domain-containing protein n=1 Tax=Hirsutella rhossiliensis TaxID=111463 RepID=A0A9P8MW67_9HYPO|nr:rhoGAP domain-containing protein [Hirsutella rhossiliensis]KAH0963208.1 rhoGAP domain-containing protein [Hirsutella rhossiliensis]